MTEVKSSRIQAIDILRGMTIAGMILVNNPGGEPVYTPLEHAEWLGLTPTDLVFPFFMFIMGITTYLSLRKFNFEWSWPCARKILKRAVLLYVIGLAIGWLMKFCYGMVSADNASLPFLERVLASANSFADCSVMRAEICSISSFTSAYFLRPTVRLATMAASDAASEPFNAETLPPPGTGSLPVTLSINSLTAKSCKFIFL